MSTIQDRAKVYADTIPEEEMLGLSNYSYEQVKAAYIAASESPSKGMKWVKYEKGNPLPDYDEYVIWLLKDGNMFIECLDKDGRMWSHEIELMITYWSPLPNRPGESGTGKQQHEMDIDLIKKFQLPKDEGPGD